MDEKYSGSQTGAGAMLNPTDGAVPTRAPMLMVALEEQARLLSKIESLTDGLKNRLQPVTRGEDPQKPSDGSNKEVAQPPMIQAFMEHNARLGRQMRELRSLLDRLEL